MNKLILSAAAIAMLFSACKKDDDGHNNGTGGNQLTLNSIYNSLAVKSKTISLDAHTGGSFYGNSGTRYVIPSDAFMTTSGIPVSGNVQIEVKEFLDRADMLFSKVLPVSNGDPLNSAGEVYINATQNGQPLIMNTGKYFRVNVPQGGTPAPGMDLFFGAPINTQANTVNWNVAVIDSAQGGNSVVYNGDTISIISDSIGYCNLDQFMSNPNYQTFTVTLSGVTIAANQQVLAYALYDNYNGLWPMSNITGNVISENHVADIPVHFVVMTIYNGDFYGGIGAATPTNGSNYTVTLSQVTPTAFAAQVSAL